MSDAPEVSEIEHQRDWYRRAWLDAMALMKDWEARAPDLKLRRAEEKLAEVRAWMRSEAIEASAYDRLHDILEKP